MTVTVERLRDLLNYDPETGVFTWRIGRKGRGCAAGAVAGRVRDHDGYCRLGIDGERYFAHQLAWLHVHGEWANSDLDHINGQPDDNRIANLRIATGSENLANARRPCHNTSGFKGVSWHRVAGKWRATIKKNRVPIHIGHFTSAEDAHAAYVAKAKELFGEFARAA